MKRSFRLSAFVLTGLLAVWLTSRSIGGEEQAKKPVEEKPVATEEKDSEDGEQAKKDDESNDQESSGAGTSSEAEIRVGKVAPFVNKGMEWLVAAQHKDGGWGGGSHAKQNIRDPHKVQTDPATTAFTAMALLRAGHTPTSGSYQESVRRATVYLADVVDKAKDEGPAITDIRGTQPQAKLGQYVDTAMTAQYLARVLPLLAKDKKLQGRIDAALTKCLAKLQASQEKNGSWGKGGGWAPVLQSSLACTALELAAANGKDVDKTVLANARKYQKGNIDGRTGRAAAGEAAGVELYSFAAGQRANAVDALAAKEVIRGAKREGKLPQSAQVSEENLRVAGVKDQQQVAKLAEAVTQDDAQVRRLDDENLLKGFGNNGGEEFLSYLLTSESLVIASAEKFNKWNDKMHGRLKKVQNQDGSWSGHHCITSPVFCTAAVVQCLTTDRDAATLIALAKRSAKADMAKKE